MQAGTLKIGDGFSRQRYWPRLANYAVLMFATVAVAGAAPAWTIELLYGKDEIAPSVLASVTEECRFPPRYPGQLGDPVGLIAAEIEAPADDVPVRVTLGATEISETSSVEVRLPEAGRRYRVAPPLVLKHEAIARLRQPIARELLRMEVEMAGRTETKTKAVKILGLEDSLTSILMPEWLAAQRLPAGERRPWLLTQHLMAAYVNENNPDLAQLVLRLALIGGDAPAPAKGIAARLRQTVVREPELKFDGYTRGEEAVRVQVRAIYNTLRKLGVRYAKLSLPSVYGDELATHRIRLPGETLRLRQANCIDGSVLMASLFLRLQLRTYLVINSTHALVAVALDPAGKTILTIETTYLPHHDFEAALAEGKKVMDAGNKRLDFTAVPAEELQHRRGVTAFFVIDVAEARANGILPLAERLRPRRDLLP